MSFLFVGVVHLTMRSVGDSAKDDLEPYVNKLFSKGESEWKLGIVEFIQVLLKFLKGSHTLVSHWIPVIHALG